MSLRVEVRLHLHKWRTEHSQLNFQKLLLKIRAPTFQTVHSSVPKLRATVGNSFGMGQPFHQHGNGQSRKQRPEHTVAIIYWAFTASKVEGVFLILRTIWKDSFCCCCCHFNLTWKWENRGSEKRDNLPENAQQVIIFVNENSGLLFLKLVFFL